MSFAVFGPGALIVTRTDVSNSTPINIGYAQEFTLDESGEVKELFGQNKYPLVAAMGTIKLTGKVKAAKISGIAVNNAFYGGTLTTGTSYLMALSSAATPTSNTTTVAPPSSGTFTDDLGVIRVSTGLPMTKVASGPTTGQYSVSGAVYTFAAADSNPPVLITYAYTVASGQNIVLANTAIGVSPTFQLDYFTSLTQAGVAKGFYIRLYACVANKLTRSFKLTDFMMPEIDFMCYENASGNLMQISYPEIG